MLSVPVQEKAALPTVIVPLGPLVMEVSGGVVSLLLPAWLTLKLLPAIAAEADLVDVDVFCVHDTVTELVPVPLDGETVSQEPLPEADQPPP